MLPACTGRLFFKKMCPKRRAGGSAVKGRPPGSQGPRPRFLNFFRYFFKLRFMLIFIGLKPHFGRLLASKPRFWPPKTRPKSIQNAFKIEVPKNMQFFNAFLSIFSLNFIFYFLKTCIFPRENHYFQGLR